MMSPAEGLRAAAKLMNEGGRHWIQGAMVCHLGDSEEGYEFAGLADDELIDEMEYVGKEFKPEECQFCAVGGLRQVMLGSAITERFTAEYRTALVALIQIIRDWKPSDAKGCEIHSLEGIVIQWNDNDAKSFNEIERGFTAAAALCDATD